jgi:hypothetical protein
MLIEIDLIGEQVRALAPLFRLARTATLHHHGQFAVVAQVYLFGYRGGKRRAKLRAKYVNRVQFSTIKNALRRAGLVKS